MLKGDSLEIASVFPEKKKESKEESVSKQIEVPTTRTDVQPNHVKETATISPNRPNYSGAHISIFGSIKEEEKKEQKEQEISKRISANKDFTQEMLISAWNKYLKEIPEGQILRQTMETCKPELTEGFNITQKVDNTFQENEMKRVMVNLLNFLKEELQNGSIQIQITLNEGVDNVKYLTPNERLQKMAKNSPALSHLIDKYKLELELS